MKRKISVISMICITGAVGIGFVIGQSYIQQLEQKRYETFKEKIENDPEEATQIAFENLKKRKEATILSDVQTEKKVIALNLVGLSTEVINEEILQLLNKYKNKSTFFVSGITVAEETEFLIKASESGHRIGSMGLDGSGKLEAETEDTLIRSFVRTSHMIQSHIKQQSAPLLYCNATEYTSKILQTAYASGHEQVVQSHYVLNYRSFTSYEQTLNYVRKLPRGAIITVKLNGELSEEEYKKPVEEKPAEDKQAGIETQTEEILSEEEGLLQVIEWLLKAMKEEIYQVVLAENLPQFATTEVNQQVTQVIKPQSTIQPDNLEKKDEEQEKSEGSKQLMEQVEKLRGENKGQKAISSSVIYTTEPAVNYSFYGIQKQEVLNNVLEALKKEQIKATFFVSEKNLREQTQEIKTIVQAGHELQMMLVDTEETDYMSVALSLLQMKEMIKTQSGQDATYVRFPYDVNYTEETLEAISATGTKVAGQTISVAKSSISKGASSHEVLKAISNQGNKTLKRGEVVYFRMDYYEEPSVIAELVAAIKKEKVEPTGYWEQETLKASYQFTTLKELAENEAVYTYPLSEEKQLEVVKHVVSLENKWVYNFEDLVKRYIGNPFANSSVSLPGFSDLEVEALDKSGRFTEEPVIFLSFDDWGSDGAINQLLYILKKYNVKATFFIRTNYIEHNPNLVRAIALEGHDIASHTDEHMALAHAQKEAGVFSELSDEEVQRLKEDVVLSYDKLKAIVGDIWLDGRAALTPFFRPPTLAVSKKGLNSIFEVGYQYSISGDFSTHDYEAVDVQELIDDFIEGIETGGGHQVKLQNGSNVIMHMSDEAKFTAEALDTVIPYYLQKGYTFARISDYLK